MGWFYFVSFVLLATFIFLNLLIGVIINNMGDIKEKEKLRQNPRPGKPGQAEANIKTLLDKIKKDMVLLETHVSLLEDLEQRKLKDDR